MFTEILKNLMTEYDLNQTQLAKKLGVKQSQISEWLKDKAKPGYDTLKTISTRLEISADYLLGLEDDFGVKIDNDAGALSNDEIHVLNEYRKLLPAYKDLIKKQLELFNEEETQIIKH